MTARNAQITAYSIWCLPLENRVCIVNAYKFESNPLFFDVSWPVDLDWFASRWLHCGVTYRVIPDSGLIHPEDIGQFILFKSHLCAEVQNKPGDFVHKISWQSLTNVSSPFHWQPFPLEEQEERVVSYHWLSLKKLHTEVNQWPNSITIKTEKQPCQDGGWVRGSWGRVFRMGTWLVIWSLTMF